MLPKSNSYFDTVFVCIPDNEKLKVVNYCINNKKHVLLEKPFLVSNSKIFLDLEKRAREKKVVCYTAYNHRFEPAINKMKDLLKSRKLGKLYECRILYGNGTSLLVRKSKWRIELNQKNECVPHILTKHKKSIPRDNTTFSCYACVRT